MAQLDAFRYALPTTARGGAQFPARVREGLFLRIEHDGGYGIGEFAPLAGIHHTSVYDGVSAVHELSLATVQRLFDDAASLSFVELADYFRTCSPPLLARVLSMAYFHRTMMMHDEQRDCSLKLAALIEVHDVQEAIALAQTYGAQGFGHLKIKVGVRSIIDEIHTIKTIAALVGPSVKLRLDGNRRLSIADASALLRGLKRVQLDYFEEPTHEVSRLHELADEHGVNLAVDESLLDVDDLSWLPTAKISHVIIKPMRFDNLFTTFKLVHDTRAMGLTPILSHCFESEFSSAIFAMMIHQLKLHDDAHGILVDGVFRHGVFTEPLRSFRGQLSIARARSLSVSPFLRAGDVFTAIV